MAFINITLTVLRLYLLFDDAGKSITLSVLRKQRVVSVNIRKMFFLEPRWLKLYLIFTKSPLKTSKD